MFRHLEMVPNILTLDIAGYHNMLYEVVYSKIRQRLRSMIIGGTALVLTAMIIGQSFGSACTNWTNVALLKFYFRAESLDHAILEPCATTMTHISTAQLWSQGLAVYLHGDHQHAEPLLVAAMTAASAIERMYRIDQLLSFVTIVSPDDPTQADDAIDLARRYQHNSPIGYMRLAQIYIDQARNGDTTNWDRVQEITRLAGETSQAGFLPKLQRAKDWFYLGEFSKNSDPDKALTAYLAAIAEDPQDQSHGYASDSALNIAKIYINRQQFDAARRILNFATSLPSPYHNYSQARLQLARLEREQQGSIAAITIMEETVRHEPDYIATRLYLAFLYLDTEKSVEAIAQYQEILKLDPSHVEAQTALAKLEGEQ